MKSSTSHIIIFLSCLLCSCKRTSTPKEYLNNYKVDKSEYKKDKKSLTLLTKSWRDSLREKSKTPEGKTLEVHIDTIFYNSSDKIVFLSISKKENKYALNEDKISFSGECYIGVKESETNIKILDRLKYGANSAELDGFERVNKSIREIYLTEMEFIDGRFNINDNRFWTSKVWNEK